MPELDIPKTVLPAFGIPSLKVLTPVVWFESFSLFPIFAGYSSAYWDPCGASSSISGSH